MKHIFLDFDRTLFDTEQFYNSLELTYIEGIIAGSIGADFSRFLYPDVLSFILNVREANFSCHLVTFGRRGVQECKFKLSGLEPYFDQMFYVEQGSKASVIQTYLEIGIPGTVAYFVDDSVEHLSVVATQVPVVTPIRICRPGAKGSKVLDDRFTTIQSLDELWVQLSV